MPTVTLVKARQMLAEYIKAEEAVLTGQSYSIGNRTLTRAHINAIRAGRKEWESIVRQLEQGGGSMRVRRVLFRDG